MCFFFSFLPATVFTTIGFFVLFVALKAEGRLKTFGKILAIWIFFVAACIPICGAILTILGLCPLDCVRDIRW